MAKIYIKSREPIVVDSEKALKIKNDWMANPKSRDIAEVDGSSFSICDIKGFDSVIVKGEDYDGKKYNLNVPEDKQRVRDFEKEFLAWKAGEGKQYGSVMDMPRFLESKKACRVRGDGKDPNDIIITDVALYGKLMTLHSTLRELMVRREMAKKIEEKSMDSLVDNTGV